jgi:hypothetical protein
LGLHWNAVWTLSPSGHQGFDLATKAGRSWQVIMLLLLGVEGPSGELIAARNGSLFLRRRLLSRRPPFLHRDGQGLPSSFGKDTFLRWSQCRGRSLSRLDRRRALLRASDDRRSPGHTQLSFRQRAVGPTLAGDFESCSTDGSTAFRPVPSVSSIVVGPWRGSIAAVSLPRSA